MGDLISRSRLKAELESWAVVIQKPNYYLREDANFIIDAQAAVEVHDIVHCWECKYWRRDEQIKGNGRCRQYSATKYEKGFCDRGERKSDV